MTSVTSWRRAALKRRASVSGSVVPPRPAPSGRAAPRGALAEPGPARVRGSGGRERPVATRCVRSRSAWVVLPPPSGPSMEMNQPPGASVPGRDIGPSVAHGRSRLPDDGRARPRPASHRTSGSGSGSWRPSVTAGRLVVVVVAVAVAGDPAVRERAGKGQVVLVDAIADKLVGRAVLDPEEALEDIPVALDDRTKGDVRDVVGQASAIRPGSQIGGVVVEGAQAPAGADVVIGPVGRARRDARCSGAACRP